MRKIKDKWIGARADEDLEALVDTYADAADISMGDLVRKSVREYMLTHPIAPTTPVKVKK